MTGVLKRFTYKTRPPKENRYKGKSESSKYNVRYIGILGKPGIKKMQRNKLPNLVCIINSLEKEMELSQKQIRRTIFG